MRLSLFRRPLIRAWSNVCACAGCGDAVLAVDGWRAVLLLRSRGAAVLLLRGRGAAVLLWCRGAVVLSTCIGVVVVVCLTTCAHGRLRVGAGAVCRTRCLLWICTHANTAVGVLLHGRRASFAVCGGGGCFAVLEEEEGCVCHGGEEEEPNGACQCFQGLYNALLWDSLPRLLQASTGDKQDSHLNDIKRLLCAHLAALLESSSRRRNHRP